LSTSDTFYDHHKMHVRYSNIYAWIIVVLLIMSAKHRKMLCDEKSEGKEETRRGRGEYENVERSQFLGRRNANGLTCWRTSITKVDSIKLIHSVMKFL